MAIGKKQQITTALSYLLWIFALTSTVRADDTDIACAPFTWAVDFDGTPKAAMLVDAETPHGNLRLQLDTGSDANVIYGAGTPGLRDIAIHHQPDTPMKIGDISLGRQALVIDPGVSPGQAVGVLGLKSLLGKVLIIDYPARTICELKHPGSEPLEEDFSYVPARLHSNKLFLFARLDRASRWGIFFDTGASTLNLLVDQAHWQQLTGRQGTESHNREIRGYSWGDMITLVGAPMTGAIALGRFVLERPVIHFIRERPERFARYPVNALGLVGNAPFLERRLLLDLRAPKIRFGIGKAGAGKDRI